MDEIDLPLHITSSIEIYGIINDSVNLILADEVILFNEEENYD